MNLARQRLIFYGGIGLCLALVGYYGYLVYRGLQPVGQTQAPLPTIVSLDEKTLLELRSKSLNGSLPLRYSPPPGVQNPQPF